MRKALIAVPVAALSLAATLISGAAANASDTTDGPRNGQYCNASATLSTNRISVSHQGMPYALNYDYDYDCISSIKYTVIRTEDGSRTGSTIISRGDFQEPMTLSDDDKPGHYLFTSGEVTGWDYTTSYTLPDAGTLDVRYNGRVGRPAAVRKHGVVTLIAKPTHYSIKVVPNGWIDKTVTGYVKWSGARVAFQKLSGTTWTTIRTVTAKKGVATAKIKSGRSKFRAVVAASAVAWGATSSAVSK